MARIQSVQSSFSEGRISPRLQGYVDLPAYGAACKTLENAIVLPQGATTKRSGTYHVAETKSSGAVRLLPFTVGLAQNYILEFGNNYFRVFSQDLRLNYHDSSSGYSSSDIYDQTTTYTSAQLDDLDFTQSADVLFIVHPDHKPAKLVRTLGSSTTNRAEDDSIWTLSSLTFTDGPYGEINTDKADTFTLSGTDKFATTDIGDFYVDTTLNQLVRKNHGLLDGQTIWVKDQGDTITYEPVSSTSGDGSPDGATSDHKKYFVVNATSDARLKENIIDTKINGLDVINAVKVREFIWKERNGGIKNVAGLIAQELKEVWPKAVSGKEDEFEEDGAIKYMSVANACLIEPMLKAIQELSAKVEALENNNEQTGDSNNGESNQGSSNSGSSTR